MKQTTAGLVFAALLVTAPAWAQTPQRAPVPCQIDLASAGFPIAAGVSTSALIDSEGELQCSGGAGDRNLQLRCQALIPNWTGGDLVARDFECLITDDLCPRDEGAPEVDLGTIELVAAERSQLRVNAQGQANLLCRTAPD